MRWRVELKRQNTDHDTPGESTKTTVRLEALPEGPVALWRLDLPFPDEKTSFSGSPFDPRLGDIKLRARLRPVEVRELPVSVFSELTWPTADPALLVEDSVTCVVQVQGKVRAKLDVAPSIAADALEQLALADANVQRAIGDGTVRKVIVKPPKVVNVVVG